MEGRSLRQLELELIDLLKGQGLPVEEIRLIGLLGKGTRASVFSVLIDGVYHIVKVYQSSETMRAELRNLKKVISKQQFFFSWEERFDNRKLNLVILEVPEGSELNSGLINQTTADRLADRLAELHMIRYRQRVSLTSLREQLERYSQPYLAHIRLMGREVGQYQTILDQLHHTLDANEELFRTRKVRIHGDLWWPNVIVAREDVYLVDWESMRRGDAAEDIAKLRIIVYGPRNLSVPTFFWQSSADGSQLSLLIKTIVERHHELAGDDRLIKRLTFYLPFLAVQELGARYISGDTKQAMNPIIADDLLGLAADPLAPPPDLTRYGYFEELERERAS